MRCCMDCLISVVIPAYNVEKYIDDCLASISHQTYSNIEIIVINDGSTDNTGKIINEYASTDHRFIVINQENHGLVVSRKNGLKRANGEYCIFVDGDDWIDKNLIQNMASMIQASDYDAVHANYYEEKMNSSLLQRNVIEEVKLDLNREEKRIEVLKNSFFRNENTFYITPSIWARIYKTEVVRELYSFIPDEQSYGEDILLLMHLLLSGKKIFLTEKAFYHYRVIGDSLSHSYGINDFIRITKLYLCIKEVLKYYGFGDELAHDAEFFYWGKLLFAFKNMERPPLRIAIYMFPNPEMFYGKTIVLYGAGLVGKDYYSQFSENGNTTIYWVDKKYGQIVNGYEVQNPLEVLKHNEFDYILVAVNDKKVSEEIFKDLKKLDVPIDKIIWEKPLSAYDLVRN